MCIFFFRVPVNSTSSMADYDRESVELVEVFLTCGFESMNSADINNFQLRNSADSRLLWGCVQRKGSWTPAAAVDCFLQARKACLKRSVKMVKTIRLRGRAARQLMERNEDLKIVYLIRDPRGTLTSQKRVFGNFKWENVGNYSASYCRTVLEDLGEIGKLIDQYPSRVKVFRYENLAESPLQLSEQLYRFLGLNYTTAVRTFVFNKTMAGKTQRNAYGTSRSNSTKAAYSWRKDLTLSAAQTIDQNCRGVYEILGYVPVSSREELLDFSRVLRKPVHFHGQWL